MSGMPILKYATSLICTSKISSANTLTKVAVTYSTVAIFSIILFFIGQISLFTSGRES